MGSALFFAACLPPPLSRVVADIRHSQERLQSLHSACSKRSPRGGAFVSVPDGDKKRYHWNTQVISRNFRSVEDISCWIERRRERARRGHRQRQNGNKRDGRGDAGRHQDTGDDKSQLNLGSLSTNDCAPGKQASVQSPPRTFHRFFDFGSPVTQSPVTNDFRSGMGTSNLSTPRSSRHAINFGNRPTRSFNTNDSTQIAQSSLPSTPHTAH